MEANRSVRGGLTLYDMLKAIDRGMVIGEIRLERKSGGESGDWKRGSGDRGSKTDDRLSAMMRFNQSSSFRL